MSGPVWKVIREEPSRCDGCGQQIKDYRAVGHVVDGSFQPIKRYCEGCYEALGMLRDDVA